MKLSNNAIKFLMAQYRAIYKNAYFKGIASAVVLTSALAAGQTQAAPLAADTDLTTLPDTVETITIKDKGNDVAAGEFTAINIADDASATKIKDKNILITSGDAAGTGNYVKGNTGDKNGVLVAKNLTLESAGAKTVGLAVIGNSNGTGTATFDTVNIIKGTLSAEGADTKSGSIFASKIIVGGATTEAAGDAILEIKDKGVVGKTLTAISKISDGTQIVLDDNALMQASKSGGGTSAVVVNAASLSIDGGKIVTNGKNTDKSGLTINLVKGTMTAGAIEIASGDTLTVSFAGDANTIDDLDTQGNKIANATTKADRTFNITGGALTLKGATTVSGNGTLAIGDSVQFTGETAGADLTVSGSAAQTQATLKVSAAKLKDIAAKSKLSTENAIVQLTDDNYDLGDLGITLDDSTADLNTWAAKDGSTIKGQNLTVGADLANGTNLTVEAAEKLTLGKTSGSAVDIAGVAGFKAKHVEFISHNGTDAFTLKKKLDLSSVSADGKTADSGTIEGAVVVSGTLTINGGNYSSKDNVKVSGASVTASGSTVDSTLSLTGDVVVTAAAASKFVADGAKAVVDLTKVKSISMSGSTAAAALDASNKGTIKIKGEDFSSLLSTTGATDKVLATLTDDGVLLTTGSLTLAQGKIGKSASAGIKTTKGTLVAEELTITGANTDVDLGTDGKIEAKSLTLTADDAANPAKLSSGNYTVLEALSSDTAKDITLGENATLNLGKISTTEKGVNSAVTEAGTVSSAIVLNHAAAKLNIDSGIWTATGDLTNTQGALTIGSAAEKKDASGNAIEAGLTVTGKFTNTSGSTVQKWGTLTTSDTDLQTNSKLTVNGTYTLNGKYNDGGTPSNTSDDTYGIKLASGTVDLNGTMTLGADAMKIFTVNKSGDIAIAENTISDAAITSNVGSTLVLNFAVSEDGEKVALSTTGLDSIKDLLAPTVGGTITLNGASIKELTVDEATNTVKWEDAKKVQDYLGDYIDPAVQQATLTGVTTADKVVGHFGAIKSNDSGLSTNSSNVSITKKAGFYNAISKTTSDGKKYFALGQNDSVLGFNVDAKSQLTLANGGVTSQIKLGNDSYLFIDSNNGITEILNNISGTSAEVQVRSGKTSVAGAVNVNTLGVATGADLAAGGNVTANKLSLTAGSTLAVGGDLTQKAGDTPVVMAGKLDVAGTATFAADVTATGNINVKGDATFSKSADLKGNNTFEKALTVTTDLDVTKGLTLVKGNATLAGADITNGGALKVDGKLSLTGTNPLLAVGSDDSSETTTGTGSLEAKTLDLAGGTVFVDPAWNEAVSLAKVGNFTHNGAQAEKSVISGTVVVGQNSAVLVGDKLETANGYLASKLNATGSLSKDKTGAVLYVNSQQTVENGSKIVVDAAATQATALKNGNLTDKYTEGKTYGSPSTTQAADLYLGANTVLALGNNANMAKTNEASIVFKSADAGVYAEKDATIVLDGESFVQGSRNIKLFSDAGTAGSADGVKILGSNDIRVETVNGLLTFTLAAGTETSGGELKLDKRRVSSAYLGASEPMRDFLIGYAAQEKNWEQVYADTPVSGAKSVALLGETTYDQKLFEIADGKITALTEEGQKNELLKDKDLGTLVAVNVGSDKKQSWVVYEKSNNPFLEQVSRNTDGLAADQAARMGVFGGAPQVALTATSTTSDAVAGLFGMGNAAAALTYADNGQGTGLWVTPVYRSADSDGFSADGLQYGADVSLFGVALGGDYSLGNGVRAGAMINIGSGDADGQGAASAVTNDFNYFGGALYAGYSMDALSIVADLSYTTIDSDVQANTTAGQVSSSFDTTTLSAGVTGQYTMNLGSLSVAPHAGLRFTRIDMDDYVITSAEFGDVGGYAASSANVFSIPVGVTISKEYAMDNWSIKPAFDLTLTGNFGDDTADGTVTWTDVTNWDVATKSEFVDSFSYGAAMGVAAKSGNLGLGFGLNYTGSSNVKEFGANANVRYVF